MKGRDRDRVRFSCSEFPAFLATNNHGHTPPFDKLMVLSKVEGRARN